MTERLKKLCGLLESCRRFVDVGCDHGYCTRYMLDSGLCGSAVIADISAKSLSKAERLLGGYIASGRCTSVCCDGLTGIARGDDLVLIAGMGGEEILKILKNSYIPASFVFQPMKNAPELRAYLIEKGCEMIYDGVFTERRGSAKKYYFVIKGRAGKTADNGACNGGAKGAEQYSPLQLAFGRDSLGTDELNSLLWDELKKNESYAGGSLSEASRRAVEERMQLIKEALKA